VLHPKHLGIAYLILEWASIGSLARVIKDGLPEPTVASIFRQVIEGVSYLHGQGIVHRDIKPSNILLFTGGTAKLSDFGVGHSFSSADTVIGTPAYQPPEYFDDSPDIVLDPVKEDVWSMGVSIFEAAFGDLPYSGTNVYEISWSILHQPLVIPDTASPQIADLLMRMLTSDPSARASVQDVRAHPFIRDAEPVFHIDEATRPIPSIPQRAVQFISANVCDENYTFVGQQRSVSLPATLYGLY
jgi:serine/threonine-protein kinase 11